MHCLATQRCMCRFHEYLGMPLSLVVALKAGRGEIIGPTFFCFPGGYADEPQRGLDISVIRRWWAQPAGMVGSNVSLDRYLAGGRPVLCCEGEKLIQNHSNAPSGLHMATPRGS